MLGKQVARFLAIYCIVGFLAIAIGESVTAIPAIMIVGNVLLASAMTLLVLPWPALQSSRKKIANVIAWTCGILFVMSLVGPFLLHLATWAVSYSYQLWATVAVSIMIVESETEKTVQA